MNIEESKNLLGWVSLNKLYIDTHNECDYHNIHTAIETLLTAYEKQQKEIEELKEVKWYYEISRVPKDKIKAKIEELEKGNKNTFIRGEKILVLQSLLEKE